MSYYVVMSIERMKIRYTHSNSMSSAAHRFADDLGVKVRWPIKVPNYNRFFIIKDEYGNRQLTGYVFGPFLRQDAIDFRNHMLDKYEGMEDIS